MRDFFLPTNLPHIILEKRYEFIGTVSQQFSLRKKKKKRKYNIACERLFLIGLEPLDE